jgi:hypothetical protein
MLEVEFSAELHRARQAGTGGLSKGGIRKTDVDAILSHTTAASAKIGVIEEVESLSAHLQIDPFADCEVLQQA